MLNWRLCGGVRFALALSFVASALAAPARAQAPTADKRLPVDSPVLHEHFFYFHSSFTEWDARKSGQSPAEAADLDRKAAATLGLQANEHQALTALTTVTATELRAIDAERKAYLNARAAKEQRGLPSDLQKFEARRQDAVTRGAAALQNSLAPTVWNAVRGYINGPYREGIRVQ